MEDDNAAQEPIEELETLIITLRGVRVQPAWRVRRRAAHRMHARMCVLAQVTKVKAQQSACDDVDEWLRNNHNWQSLLGKLAPSFAPSPVP